MNIENISEEEFNRYRKVQMSGEYNMLMERQSAMMEADLDEYMYKAIQMNYKALTEKYGEYKRK